MLCSVIIIFVKSKVLKIPESEFDKYLMLPIVAAFFLGLILKLFRIIKPDPLRGKLDGFLTFEPHKIIAGDTAFPMEEIKKVRITNDDYYGKAYRTGRSFNSNLSNGVDNVCEITLLDGSVFQYNYELYYPNDLQKNKNELISYYKNGKLDFNNLVDILGISKKEIQEFRENIDRQ